MLVSTTTVLVNKATAAQLAAANSLFQNVDITAEQLAQHVQRGHAFCAQHKNHWRKSANFTGAGFLAADIDHGLPLEAAVADPFVQQYASFIYTTPSHTDSVPRFRIVCELERPITDAAIMTAGLTGLIVRFGADDSCKDACRLFYGSSKSRLIMFGNTLPETQLQQLVLRAGERSVMSDSTGEESIRRRSATRSKLDLPSDTPVRLASGEWLSLRTIPNQTQVHCPMHVDHRPSALALRNRWGNPGIYCSTCHATFFMEDGFRSRRDEYEFDYHWGRVLRVTYEEYETHADDGSYVNLSELRGGRIRQLNADKLSFDEVAPSHQRPLNDSDFKQHAGETPSLVADCRVTLVKSPKGSGKTEWLGHLVRSHRTAGATVILIGHRRALINATARRIGLTSYLGTSTDGDDDAGAQQIRVAPDGQYAICVDSLPLIDTQTVRYDIVLIDEVEQVLGHLLSSTLRENRRNALHTMKYFVNQAKAIYLLDADLGKVTIDLISEMFDDPAQSYQAIINDWKPQGRTVYVYEDSRPDHLIGELVASLERGERCFVCSNSKRMIDELHAEIPKRVSRTLKAVAITSDNSQTPQMQALIGDIKHRALEFDVIFASPSIGTGIDITFPGDAQHIARVYGFFQDRVNTHFEIDQQLCRVRHPEEVHVWVSPKEYHFETDAAVIKAELVASQAEHRAFIGIAPDGTRLYASDPLYEEVFATITAAQRASKNRLRHHFIKLREANGWSVQRVARDDTAREVGRTVSKAATEERIRAERAKLLAARGLSHDAYERLREKEKRDRISEDDAAALRRYELESFYLQDLTPELLALDDDGKLQAAIRLFENLTISNQELKRRDERNRLDFLPDELQQLPKKQMLVKLLEASGLMVGGVLRRDAQVDVSTLRNFIGVVTAEKAQVERLFGIDVRNNVMFDPVKQLKAFLKLIGLSLPAIKRDQSGKKSVKIYGFDQERLNLLQALADRRADPARRDAWDSLRLIADRDFVPASPEVDPLDATTSGDGSDNASEAA